jgi:hypothetical protein
MTSRAQATVSPYSTITVRSLPTGASLTPGDNLHFSYNSCQSTLGWEQCPQLWGINVEVVATVPDIVDNWTVSQYVLSNSFHGYLKDVNTGAMSPINSSDPNGFDGPYDNIQKISGTKTMYYLDDPGVKNVRFNGTQVIDSGTYAVNYETRLCNNAQPSACTIYDWYIRVIITPGGQLSFSQSSTGPGSTQI